MDVANTLEGIIKSAVLLHNNLLDWLIREIFRIDKLSGTEFFGNFEFVGVDIDADNLGSACLFATHQCC